MRSFILILLGLTALPSCAKAPPPTSPEPAASPTLSAAQCEAGGSTVVGDIGDGAIHQPG